MPKGYTNGKLNLMGPFPQGRVIDEDGSLLLEVFMWELVAEELGLTLVNGYTKDRLCLSLPEDWVTEKELRLLEVCVREDTPKIDELALVTLVAGLLDVMPELDELGLMVIVMVTLEAKTALNEPELTVIVVRTSETMTELDEVGFMVIVVGTLVTLIELDEPELMVIEVGTVMTLVEVEVEQDVVLDSIGIVVNTLEV